jgi:hypothetical protein
MVKNHEPAVIFKDEDVGGNCLGAANLFVDGRADVGEASNPGDVPLDFDGNIGNVHAHERRIAKNLFPAGANILPAGQAVPIRLDADGACIRSPYFFHQIHVQAFECEVKFEVGFYYVFRIGHTA